MIRNFLKLLITGDRQILAKSEEYRAQREKRYADFDKSRHNSGTDPGYTLDNEILDAIARIRKLSASLGIATTEEIIELKKKIDALGAKFESLHEKQ
jgi:hypothetical protein